MISIDQTPDIFSIRHDLYTPPSTSYSPPSIFSAPPPPSYPSYAHLAKPGPSPKLTPESNSHSINDDYESSGEYLLFSQWEDSDSDGASQTVKRARLDNLDNTLTQVIPDTQ